MNQQKTKVALITGADGQDFFYMSCILLAKGYKVIGVSRRTGVTTEEFLKSKPYSTCIDCENCDPHDVCVCDFKNKLEIVYGDMSDENSLYYLMNRYRPDEVYNFAGFSHPGMSFEQPEIAININGVGTLRLLEIIKNHFPQTKFLQVSSPDIFAEATTFPQTEETKPCPNSPYGISKLMAHNLVDLYRNVHKLFAINAICYNHESPLRNPMFVTKKITKFVAEYNNGLIYNNTLKLGNLSAMRDWGSARDYCMGMYLAMQHHTPDNYLFATGKITSVRHFCELAFRSIYEMIIFEGEGQNEIGYINDVPVVVVDKTLYRPIENKKLIGDASKAKKILGWSPTTTLSDIIEEMVRFDISKLQTDKQKQ